MLEPLGIAGLPQDISEGIGGLITLGNIQIAKDILIGWNTINAFAKKSFTLIVLT